MKPLPYTRPRVTPALRANGWFTPAVVVSLVVLEVVGRQTVTDLHDTLAGTALLVLSLIVAARHRATPLGWIEWLARQGNRFLRWSERFRIDLGLDLRGTPPIPRRMPRAFYGIVIGVAVWAAAALAGWYYFPQGWRNGLIQVWYLGYLAFVVLFWGVLFLGALAGVYFPVMLVTRLFPRSLGGPVGPKMSRPQFAAVLAYAAVVWAAFWLLPLWIVPALCLVVLAGLAAGRLVRPRPGIQFIWRPRGSRRVYSIPARRLLLTVASVLVLSLLALILTACGGRILGGAPDPGLPAGALAGGVGRLMVAPVVGAEASMPVTLLLGTSLAWLTPGLLLSGGIWFLLAWRQSPARPCPPTAYVSGPTVPAARRRVARVFRAWGWRVRFEPARRQRTDVRVRLVEPARSEARDFNPGWPLRVSVEDLEDGSVRERLERRHELRCRRLLLKGLEKLLRHARGRHFSGGSGFWLAPHLWLLGGMTRDDIEDGDSEEPNLLMRSVGPPYQQIFPRVARHYLYRVLRALEVDLIFVEDGIDHRKLSRVVRVLFEVYDKFAGKRRAEEIQFQGLPRVKVMIHDFQLDQPFESSTYPEPRFEDLGRARILHVFRDRGDQEDRVEPPFDTSRNPAPLWMN